MSLVEEFIEARVRSRSSKFAHDLSAKLATRSRHLCAFLGAGVARACGLPDVAQLQSQVVDALTGDDRKAFEEQLKGRNLEQALSRLRRIAAVLTAGQTLDGLTAAQAIQLDATVCQKIVEKLDISSANLLPIYSLAAWAGRANYHLPLELFTVNYDLLIESGLERLRVPYFDGLLVIRLRKYRCQARRHGQEAAYILRRYLGYSDFEVSLDVYRDLRQIGIHVFRRKLQDSNISGLYVRNPVAGDCILINYSEDIYRQRFTAAHEAAHAILDWQDHLVVSFKNDKEDREVQANKFASNYLVPGTFLRGIPQARIWTQQKALLWANKFKVSTEVLAYALKRERLINAATVDTIKTVRVPSIALWRNFSKRSF